MGFLQLPLEIKRMINHYLDDVELDTMRFVNRETRDGVAGDWAERNIAERNHVTSIHSLRVLAEISAHPIFAPYIKTIVFNVFYHHRAGLGPETQRPFKKQEVVAYIKDIFRNIKANQTSPVTIAFSDNFPTITRGACASPDFYRYSEKPSYGWRKMMSQKDGPVPQSKRRDYSPGQESRFGYLTMARLTRLVLPIACKSQCLIAGLEVRFVGLFLTTTLPLSTYIPALMIRLPDFSIVPWDVRFLVVEDKCEEAHDNDISFVAFEHATKKLTFNHFKLGYLNPDSVYCSVYQIFQSFLGRKIKQLQIQNSWVVDPEQFRQQMARLFRVRQHDQDGTDGCERLEHVMISGLFLIGNLGWGRVLTSLANIDHVKRLSLQGIPTAQAAPELSLDITGDIEQGYQSEEEVGMNKSLHDAIKNLSVRLDTDRGDDIKSVLLAMASHSALAHDWRSSL